MILDVAGGKHAGDAGGGGHAFSTAMGPDVAGGIHVDCPAKICVLGRWPMAMKQPISAISRVALLSVERIRTPVTPESSPSTSSSVWFQTISTFGGPCHQLVDQDGLAEAVAPVDDGHFVGDVG